MIGIINPADNNVTTIHAVFPLATKSDGYIAIRSGTHLHGDKLRIRIIPLKIHPNIFHQVCTKSPTGMLMVLSRMVMPLMTPHTVQQQAQ